MSYGLDQQGCQGTSEVSDGVSSMALHKLGVGRDEGRVRPTSWGWLFWLVQLRSGGRMDLRAGIERRRACALVLVLVLVVACGGADGNGCSVVGTATSKVSGHFAVAAAAVSAGVCI